VDHCTIPGCESATVEVTLPVTVTVLDTDAVPQVGLPVYVFNEAVYTGFNDTTDGNGEVSFTLPQGDYRFRSDLNGTQFWSDAQNHCTIPGCESASITVTIPVTVTVQSQTGSPYPDLPVYVFSGESYTGFNDISDVNGQVIFTLPAGDYRFRSDYDGVQFWSDDVDHCSIPGCLEATVEFPGGTGEVNVTIDYTYDPLYRLTEADYSTGEYFYYTYDAVGNRLTQETHEGSNTYEYDNANRLIEVDGVTFIWDDNGNLIQDDRRIYNYDYANRLRFVLMDGDTYSIDYNGLGDRLRQTVNGVMTDYTLDINRGLSEVLHDGSNVYLYGMQRIGELQTETWLFHLGDAIRSLRILSNNSADVLRSQTYDPYGEYKKLDGVSSSSIGFTSEWRDENGLLFLRSRYYDPKAGRFITKDIWDGNVSRPQSLIQFTYTENNPILYRDPSGQISETEAPWAELAVDSLKRVYGIEIVKDWGWRPLPMSTLPYSISDLGLCPRYWYSGNWRNLKELSYVLEAVNAIAPRHMTYHKFRSIFNHTRIARTVFGFKYGDAVFTGMAPPGVLSRALGDVVLPNYTFDQPKEFTVFTIIHELGHVWDYRSGNQLSMGMMQALGTWICDDSGNNCVWHPYAAKVNETTLEIEYVEPYPGTRIKCLQLGPVPISQEGCGKFPYGATLGQFPPLTEPGAEDWANSFASFIYPDYYRQRNLLPVLPGGIRETYIKSKLTR
jgi:RHS repeat-associated protein